MEDDDDIKIENSKFSPDEVVGSPEVVGQNVETSWKKKEEEVVLEGSVRSVQHQQTSTTSDVKEADAKEHVEEALHQAVAVLKEVPVVPVSTSSAINAVVPVGASIKTLEK